MAADIEAGPVVDHRRRACRPEPWCRCAPACRLRRPGAASASRAAAPSKILFMIVPRSVNCDTQGNNVASIGLLRGNAGALIVRNCDGAATKRFCSIAALRGFFARKPAPAVTGCRDRQRHRFKARRNVIRRLRRLSCTGDEGRLCATASSFPVPETGRRPRPRRARWRYRRHGQPGRRRR